MLLNECLKGSVYGLLSIQPEEGSLIIVCYRICPLPRPGQEMTLGAQWGLITNSFHGAS